MLTEDAKTRLEAVAVAIEAEPLRIDMDGWCLLKPGDREGFISYPECGIVGCIAGWTVALDARRNHAAIREIGAFGEAAMNILGLSGDQPSRLFYTDGWPARFLDPDADEGVLRGNPQAQTPEYAAVVAERIRFFIETDGTDEE